MKRPLALVLIIAAALAAFLALALSGRREADLDEADVLRVPLAKNVKTLDPVGITDVYSDGVAQRVYNCLVQHAPDMSIVPDLAESWDVSADGLVYTFRIRKGVKFHHGRELVAADFVYSLTRLADPRVSAKRELIEDVRGAVEYGELLKKVMDKQPVDRIPEKLEGLAAPDERTLVVTLRRPNPIFLSLMAMSPASAVPREEVEHLGEDFATRPVGTGPFRFVRGERNDRIELERFDEHFAGRPNLARVHFRIIDDSQVRLDSYLNGELDITDVPLGRLPFSLRNISL